MPIVVGLNMNEFTVDGLFTLRKFALSVLVFVLTAMKLYVYGGVPPAIVAVIRDICPTSINELDAVKDISTSALFIDNVPEFMLFALARDVISVTSTFALYVLPIMNAFVANVNVLDAPS